MLVKKIKAALASRGARGFIGLQRKFRIMDDDDSKSLNLGEFKKGLIESGLEFGDKDMRRLFECFDAVSARLVGRVVMGGPAFLTLSALTLTLTHALTLTLNLPSPSPCPGRQRIGQLRGVHSGPP